MENKSEKMYTRKQLVITSVASLLAVPLILAVIIGIAIKTSDEIGAENNEHLTSVMRLSDKVYRGELEWIGDEYLTGISQVINIDELDVDRINGDFIITATTSWSMIGKLTSEYLSQDEEGKSEYIKSIVEPFKLAQNRAKDELVSDVILQFKTHDMDDSVFLKMNGDYVEYFFLEEYYLLKSIY